MSVHRATHRTGKTQRAGRTLRLDESLTELSARLGAAAPAAAALVFTKWREIVGDVLADHVRPEHLDGDVLIVAVESPAWATRLHNISSDVLRPLQDALGADSPVRLVVRVRPAKQPRDQGVRGRN